VRGSVQLHFPAVPGVAPPRLLSVLDVTMPALLPALSCCRPRRRQWISCRLHFESLLCRHAAVRGGHAAAGVVVRCCASWLYRLRHCRCRHRSHQDWSAPQQLIACEEADSHELYNGSAPPWRAGRARAARQTVPSWTARAHTPVRTPPSKNLPNPAFEQHRAAMGLVLRTSSQQTSSRGVSCVVDHTAPDNVLTYEALCASSPLLELGVCVGLYRELPPNGNAQAASSCIAVTGTRAAGRPSSPAIRNAAPRYEVMRLRPRPGQQHKNHTHPTT
jgi:hypothetical protein